MHKNVAIKTGQILKLISFSWPTQAPVNFQEEPTVVGKNQEDFSVLQDLKDELTQNK